MKPDKDERWHSRERAERWLNREMEDVPGHIWMTPTFLVSEELWDQIREITRTEGLTDLETMRVLLQRGVDSWYAENDKLERGKEAGDA